MFSPTSHTIQRGCWAVLLSLLSIAVLIVLTIFFGLLLDLFQQHRTAPSPSQVAALTLPTANPPTATLGPPLPDDVRFIPETPVKGFSNCEAYGFRGLIKADVAYESVQVVVWQDGSTLLKLDSVDPTGHYHLEFTGQPAQRKVWIQVYQDDLPVSKPFPLEIQIDCQRGFQVYEIDWNVSLDN